MAPRIALLLVGLFASDWEFVFVGVPPPRAIPLTAKPPPGSKGLARKDARYALLPLAGRKVLVAASGSSLWFDRDGDGTLSNAERLRFGHADILLAIGPGGATRAVRIELCEKGGSIVYRHRLRRTGHIVLEGRLRAWALIDGNHDLRFDAARTDCLLLDTDGDGLLDPVEERHRIDDWFECRAGWYRFERGDFTGERFSLSKGEPRPRVRERPGPDRRVEDVGQLLRAGSSGDATRRRACLSVLRRMREPRELNLLIRALRSKDESRRAFARAVLTEIPDPGVARALVRARREARQSAFGPELRNQTSSAVVRALLPGFEHADLSGRRGLIRRAVARGPELPAVEATIRDLLGRKEWTTRALTLLQLRLLGQGLSPTTASRIVELLGDPVWQVRLSAAEVLEFAALRNVVPPMIAAMEKERNARIRRALALSLYRITGAVRTSYGWDWRRWWDDEGARFVVPLDRPPHDPPRKKKKTGERRSVASFFGIPLESSRVIFLVDASGSMLIQDRIGARARFDVALDQLARAFRNLPPGAEANVIFFSDKIWKWKPRITEVSASARKSIRTSLATKKPGGGTHLYEGFEAAFADRRADTIVLLSDGKPSGGKIEEPLEIEKAILDWNSLQRLTIHCVVVGYHSPTLQRIAERTGGTYVKR